MLKILAYVQPMCLPGSYRTHLIQQDPLWNTSPRKAKLLGFKHGELEQQLSPRCTSLCMTVRTPHNTAHYPFITGQLPGAASMPQTFKGTNEK